MVFRNLTNVLKNHYYHSLGWKTQRKIVVFESDDWGSIRMPSVEVYKYLLSKDIEVDKCPFSKYDSLASPDDLTALFDVLSKHKDTSGNPPVITVNTVMVNPDFEKILSSNFSQYHWELFTETLQRYPQHKNSFKLWKEGISAKLFSPQLHGREHLNVGRWLRFLKNGSYETKIAFEREMFGLSTASSIENRKSFMAALDYENKEELEYQKASLVEAQRLFVQVFGYFSLSFIAPNYVWSRVHEQILSENKVRYIQGIRHQIFPTPESHHRKGKKHFLGEKNQYGQYYLVRNCFFEPSLCPQEDVVSKCLGQISAAFFWNKPAIVCTHRLNFMGFLDESNRKSSLSKLDELLEAIIKKWPEVEFLSSDKLGLFMEKGA